MEKLLEIKDLCVEYHTDEAIVHALNRLNFSMYRGETRGLVGETGAGKSTMALSIMRLLPEHVSKIKNGSIVYRGEQLLEASQRKIQDIRGKHISMIFQDPMSSLNPIISVGDQIKEQLDLHFPEMTVEEKAKRVDEIMLLVGIPAERKNEYPHQFSGGMKQRIMIAMALICEPDLMLADEPTTALDVTIQAQILQLMKELKTKIHSSMVLITHDLGIVAEFCDSVSIMYAGQIVESGSVEDIFERKHNHPYTAGLFNCIPYLDTKVKRLTPIEGYMIDATDLPSGCKFCDRCPHAKDICAEKEPPVFTDGNHDIKCYLFSDWTRKEYE